MPNWCYNQIVISGDKENIDKFDAFLKEKNGEDWFDFFLATPDELNQVSSPNRDGNSAEQLRLKYGASDWYDWNIQNWGCKWNCSAQNVERQDENTISFTFDSPWAPPGTLYRRIADGEFGEYDVTANYLEEGMGFVGRFSDGFDDYYEYTDLESLDGIPDDIVDQWNLREQLEDQLEWNEEEELEQLAEEFAAIEEPKGSQVNTPEGRAWLRGLLHDEEVKITFTKKDGTEREMLCTLKEDKIPSEQAPKNTGKAQSDEAIAVFDLENDGWRSFRWDSVKRIEFTLGD